MKNQQISPEAAMSLIKAMQPDPTKFLIRNRGFIDYKFSELAAHRGYANAVLYAQGAAAWADKSAEGSLLLWTWADFQEAEKKSFSNH